MSDISPLVALLTDGQTHRTWSLLVTVFGDLARAPGQEVSSAVLSRLCAHMGTRPEAVRVALHRLRKDGWLASRRQGRHAFYTLTPDGRAQSEAASPRIYGTPAAERAWLIVAQGVGTGIPVVPGLSVADAPSRASEHFSTQLTAAPPGWISAPLCPEGTVGLARETRQRFEALLPLLQALPPVDPLRIATVRVLTVHTWRRVALRLPDLPDFVLPGGGDIRAARTSFGRLLGHLPVPHPDDL